MKITKINKIKIINLCGMVSLSLLVLVIIIPAKISQIHSYNEEIISLGKTINQLRQLEQQPSVFQKKKEQITNNLNKIDDKIPPLLLVPQVIEQITKPINDGGLSLLSIAPQKSIIRNFSPAGLEVNTNDSANKESLTITVCQETPLELQLHGTYQQFGEYLERLRHLPRLIIIDSFDIQSGNDREPNLEIKLIISVFHYGKD